MRDDWNRRAREDAHYYVAFGRREQDDDEFFATATEIYDSLRSELRRLPACANERARRALEIGCGPGRLVKPMSQHFGEIHGVDVSDEMIARARRNLADIPHAHPHATTGADLAPFADDSFDFVYSYAVFQHIPSLDVVMQYLHEARRVLKPGGILRCQLNGLDKTAKIYDTWSGVRISAEEVREFAAGNNMQLLALEGARTQYMWATMRKRPAGWRAAIAPGQSRILRVTNAQNSEPLVPMRGKFAAFTILLEDLPPDCDLASLEVRVGSQSATPTYIGIPERDGLQQLNVVLGEVERTGILPLHIVWNGEPLCDASTVRVVPPGPFVPHVWAISDGINVMSESGIASGVVKVTVEETDEPQRFTAELGGVPATGYDIFCVDPSLPRYEINFAVPPNVLPGTHKLVMKLGSRLLAAVMVNVLDPGMS
jgi:SAM-dependent methyltransferase